MSSLRPEASKARAVTFGWATLSEAPAFGCSAARVALKRKLGAPATVCEAGCNRL